MAPRVFAATYTREAHKKRKNQRWKDGFLKLDGRRAVLEDEEGNELASASIDPASLAPGEDCAAFGMPWLVAVDEECGPCGGQTAPSADPRLLQSSWVASTMLPWAAPPPSAAAAVPHRPLPPASALHGGQGGGRRAFATPRPMPASAPAEPAGRASGPSGGQWGMLPGAAPPRGLPATGVLPPGLVAAPVPGRRSDEDILRLLNGVPMPVQPASRPVECTAPPQEQLPPQQRGQEQGQGEQQARKKPRVLPKSWSSFLPDWASSDRPPRASAGPPRPLAGAVGAGSRRPASSGALPPGTAQRWEPGPPAAPGPASSLGREPTPPPRAPLFGRPAAAARQLAAPPASPAGGDGSSAPAGGLRFPSANDAAALRRTVAVPDSFASAAAYFSTFAAAVVEEVHLRSAEPAAAFHRAYAQLQGGAGPAAAGHSCGAQRPAPGGAPTAEQRLRRQWRLPYYANCELTVWKPFLQGQQRLPWGRRRKKGRHGSDDEGPEPEEAGEGPPRGDSHYLVLKSGRGKSSNYRKDDLWFISDNPGFQAGLRPGQPGDRSRAPWVAVARAAWHGPSPEGKLQVEFLSEVPPRLGKSQAVYALKGPDASTELSLLALLRAAGADPAPLPLLPHLLSRAPPLPAAPLGAAGGSQQGPVSEGSVAAELAAVLQEHRLNEEQAGVLRSVAAWADASAPGQQVPVCLVHGPFGSGKSSLLVALLRLLLRLRGLPGSGLAGARVLVSAHTNTAVDRVLLGLLESGCSDFLRVGSLRRIAPRLLHQSLHAGEGKGGSAVAELRAMLAEAGHPGEAGVIRQELEAAERGAERQRKKLLGCAPIVGVTCCSALQPVLDAQRFDVVILDECSQLVEPLSLVPLLRAKARFLVAAGDPLQLPPVVASPAHVTAPPCGGADGKRPPPAGLARPLFVRLAALGHEPHFLRRQYRCHPAIAEVASQHFYGGRLLHGVEPGARPSLLPGLPNMVFLDVRGQEQYSSGTRSASNSAEAAAVVGVLGRLVAAGVELERCGVITFFRSQVYAIKSLLAQQMPRLLAAAAAAGAGGSAGDGSDAEGDMPQRQQQRPSPEAVQVATVDSFQGAEKDVIVLSTVVTRTGAFASDSARLNVALTRARHNLVVVGCSGALSGASPALAALLSRCRGMPGGYSQRGVLPSCQTAPAQAVPQPALVQVAQPQLGALAQGQRDPARPPAGLLPGDAPAAQPAAEPAAAPPAPQGPDEATVPAAGKAPGDGARGAEDNEPGICFDLL